MKPNVTQHSESVLSDLAEQYDSSVLYSPAGRDNEDGNWELIQSVVWILELKQQESEQEAGNQILTHLTAAGLQQL